QDEQGQVKDRKTRHEAPERLENRPQFLRLALGQHIAETWLSAQLSGPIGLNILAESIRMIDKRLSKDCPSGRNHRTSERLAGRGRLPGFLPDAFGKRARPRFPR